MSGSTSIVMGAAPDGSPCSGNGDCASGNCAQDYDGGGQWCAPAGNCCHSTGSTCDATCYGYVDGVKANDCASLNARWSCSLGTWVIEPCECAGPNPEDAPCAGVNSCFVGTPAICAGSCSTAGEDCDYCGSTVPGAPGSDIWKDATCDTTGKCLFTAQTNCDVCNSCYITGDYKGTCHTTLGINAYVMGVNDLVDPPNVCAPSEWCDGAGGCVPPT